MKKQLPGWAVLLIITLVAGLALGGTNALTKDPIAQQALIKAENARKAALPDAASFEELPLAEGASVDWVYAGLKDGAPVGYVAQKTVNGFGGKVEVIAGVDTKDAPDTFKIGGITVGGSDFSETAGLGARAKEPAFTDQFPGKVYPISYIKAGGEATESTVDALTSATITTTAVVNGVNDIVKYVKADVMGIAGVEMPEKPADGVFSASEKGFRGPVYVEAAFDGTGKVTYIKVGDESFAEDIGVGVIEPDFMIQFIGKQMPLEVSDIDVIAGATISSTAVVKALNNAYAIAGGAEIVVPETPTMPEKPAEGVYSASADGFRGPVYVEAAFDSDAKVTYISVGDEAFAEDVGAGVKEPEFMIQFIGKTVPLEVSDIDAIAGATISSTAVVNALNKAYNASQGIVEEVVEIVMPEKPAEGVFSAAEKGFAGPVYTEAAFDADGKITYIAVGDDSFAETEGFGAKALVPENLYPFIGAQMPLNVEDVDALSGATFTKTAIVNSLNKAYAASKGEVIEEPVVEEIVMPEKPAEGVFSAAEKGFAGPVYTEAAFDADGKITYIAVGDDSFAETEGFGAKALVPENLYPFIGAQMPLNVEDVDALSGATFTKTAIVNSLNKAYAASKGEAVEEPTKEEAPAAEPEKPAATFTAEAEGFASPVLVEAAFDGDKVTYMSIGDKRFDETPGFGARALEPEVAAAFIGKTVPMKVEDIDVLTGATFTKTAVVEALNKAYEKSLNAAPAEEKASGYVASAQGFGGPVTVEATFDGDKIASIKIGDDQFAETPGLGARALEDEFQAQFMGKQMPISLSDIDAIAGATVTSTAVVDALNAAYEQVETAAPAVEAAGNTVSASAQGFGGPVTVEATFDGDKIAAIKIGDDQFAETSGLGARALEDEFQAQFIGKQMPIFLSDIDAIAGATVTSTAVVDALNAAYAQVETTAPAAEPAAEPEHAAAEGLALTAEITSGSAVLTLEATVEDGKITALKVTPAEKEALLQEKFVGAELPLNVVEDDIDLFSAAVALNKAWDEIPTEPSAAEKLLEKNTGAAYETALDGSDIQVRVTTANGVVAGLVVLDKPTGSEAPYEVSECDAEMKNLFLAKTLPLDVNGQSTVKAATVANAINAACGFELQEITVKEEADDEKPADYTEESISGNTVLKIAAGFEDGRLTTLTIEPSSVEAAMQEKFLGAEMPVSVDQADVTALTVAVAINKAYSRYLAEQPEPAATAESEKESAQPETKAEENDGFTTVETISFFTAIRVKAAFEDGKVSDLAIADKPVGSEEDYAPSEQEAVLKDLFIAQALPLDVDAQPTPYAAAVASVLNQAFTSVDTEKAEEPAAEPAEEKEDEPVAEPAEQPAVSKLVLRVTAEFENDALSGLTVLQKAADSDDFIPCDQEEALKEKFIGQALPLDTDQPSMLETTAAIGINKAYYSAAHEAEAQQPIGGADETSSIALMGSESDEPWFSGEAISFFTAIQARVKITPALTVEAVMFGEKKVGEEAYQLSERNDELEALFVGESLPLDVKAYDDPYQSAAAIAVNEAFEQSPYLLEYNFNSASIGVGESISFFTKYTFAAVFTGQTFMTCGGYQETVGSENKEALDCEALNELLAGQQMPLPLGEFTIAGIPDYEMTAVVIALNQAYENSLAGQQ